MTTEPSENGAAVNVSLTNSGNAANVFAVIAAYGDNNLLLGIDKHEFCLSASENLTFTISEDLSKAQTIRLFVWDGENTMIPYIASIPCWTK